MNILPKKSWHVRRPENKERVRRDEENARLEERKEQNRIALAEKEARIAYLRKKNAVAGVEDVEDEKQVVKTDAPGGHLNLFSMEENAGSSGFKKENEEYVKEKREEQEKLEKRIGLLTYVGQSQLEGEGEGKLWYLEKRKEKKKAKQEEESSESEVDEPKKLRLDPLSVIEKHTKTGKRTKKERKKKKKKKKEKEGNKKTIISSSSKSIQELREERLKREQKEKQRTEALLCQALQVSEETEIGNDNNKYFSQFNPEFARRKGKR